MKLGFPHPDHWLKTVTSKQVSEWMAFATLEQVGEAIPPDKEEIAKNERKKKRANMEGYFKSKTVNK